MGEKTITRPVEVTFCDFCEKEAKNLLKCCLCGKEGCCEGGGSEHFTFALEVLRVHTHICRECSPTADLGALGAVMGAPK